MRGQSGEPSGISAEGRTGSLQGRRELKPELESVKAWLWAA